MFNSGFRGRRENDGQGSINPQAQYVQNKYPQPYISGWSISGSDDTALNPAGGQTVLVNGSGFATGISATLGGSQIGSVTLVNPTQISFTSPANAGGSYTLIVYNSTGGAAILVPGLTYSSVPTWTTAAGSIGSYYETTAINSNVVATSDSALTYTLSSGSLPSGATLYANGVITGTAPVDSGSTTYTFNITATDAELQDTTRTFTMTINVDVVTWVAPTNGTTYTVPSNVAISNVSLSATDAAGYGIVYSANSLPTGVSLTGNVIYGTPTVGANTSTLLTATANTTGRTATNTINWVVQLGDSYWNLTTLALNSLPTTTPFQNDASLNNASITPVGDTKSSPYNPYQTGYYSNYFDGSGDYLTVADNAALQFSTGNFTVECWVYEPDQSGVHNTVIGKWGTGFSTTGDWSLRTRFNSVTQLAFTLKYSGGYYDITTSFSVSNNAWHHIAVVRDSSTTIKLYADGVLKATQAVSSGDIVGSSATLSIGGNSTALGNEGASTGYISNARITKGIPLYTTTFTPSTTPLVTVAGTSLLTCQSQRLIDTSPNNFAITKNGDTTAVPANPFATQYDYGTTYYSTYFDGSGDYLSITTTSALALGSGNFTVECWIYPTSVAIAQNIICDWRTSNDNQPVWYLVNAQVYWRVNQTQLITAGTIVANTWTHLAMVKNSTTLTLYINGVSTATSSDSVTYATDATFQIGKAWSADYWNGCISNLRITKGQALYTANFTPSTSPLTTTSQGATAGNVSLLTCQSSTAIDNSTNAFAITSSGDARPVPQSPFYSAYYSGYFDGSGDYLTLPQGSAAQTVLSGGDFTIECWIYLTAVPASHGPVISSTVNSDGFVLRISSTPTVNWVIPGVAAYSFGPTLSTNTWYHIAVCRVSTTVTGYVNGTQYTFSSTNRTANASTTLQIGTDISQSTYFTGYISNLRITKGQALYTANFTPATSPLTTTSQGATAANVALLTCQSLYFIDNSTNVFAITVNGNTAVATLAPFTQPSQYGATTAVATYGSGYFDGTGDYLNAGSNGAYAFSTGAYTIELWVYHTSLASVQVYNVNQTTGGLQLWFDTTQGLSVGKYGSSPVITSGLGYIVVNQWNHIAVSRVSTSASSTRMFVNGVAVATGTDSNDYTITGPLYIGSQSAGNGVLGYISNFRMVKGTALYTANFQPSPTPLTAVTNTQILTLQYNGGSNDSQFRDGSNFQNLITRNGNATQGTFSPFSATGWSGYFDSSNYIYAASNAAFAPGTGDFTVEAWVYPTAAYTTYNYVLGVAVTGGLVFYVTGGNLVVRAYSVADQLSSATIPSLNTWTHVAASRSGTTLRIFVNGTQTATTTNSYNFVQGAAYIGNDSTNAAPWYGYISNFRFVKGQALYTTTFTPATSPLTTTSQSATAGNVSLLTLQSPSFIDNSANRFTITTAGSVKTQSFSPFSGVTTTQYYSNYFDGTGDYLSISGSSAPTGTGNFTVECWVYLGNITANATKVVYTGTTSNSFGFRIGQSFGGNVQGVGTFKSGVADCDYCAYTFAASAWYHIAIVRSSSAIYFYINGVQQTTVPTANTIGSYSFPATSTALVGYGGGSEYYTGYISNLRITNGQALYTTTFTPSTSPLTTTSQSATAANVSLLTCQSSTFIDNSTNAFAITVNGDAIPTTIAPFAATSTTLASYTTSVNGGSAYFDGTGDYVLTASTPALGTSDWTAECWFYPTALAGYGQVMGMRMNVSSGPNQYVPIYIQYGSGTGTFLFLSSTTGASWNITSGSSFGTCTTGQWFHIAVCRSGSSIYGFLNGVKKFTVNISTNSYSSTNPWHVGGNSGGDNSIGYISNCRYVIGTAIYTSAFSPPTAPPVPTAATVVLLNSTNSSIIDYTGKNDLETVGDARLAPQNPYGGSYYSNYFDGTGDYLNLAANAAFAFGTGDFTVECWVNYTNKTNSGIFQIGATLFPLVNGIGLGLDNGPNWMLYYGNGSQTAAVTGPTNGVWYHVAVVRSSSVTKVYVNGSSTISTADSANYTGSTLGIAGIYSTSYLMNGYISNFRVTKGQALYTTTFTPATSPLTTTSQGATAANVSLLTCQSSTFKDNSTNAFTVTRNGDTAVNSINPFQNNGTYSMYFDGTGDYLSTPVGSITTDLSVGDFTVECWAYFNSVSGSQIVATRAAFNTVTGADYQWSIYSSGTTLYVRPYQSTTDFSISVGTITTGQWYYVTLVRSGTSVMGFLNGVKAGTTQTVTGALNNSTSWPGVLIGNNQLNGTNQIFTGYITDLRVTKYARYTTTFTPPTSTFQTK